MNKVLYIFLISLLSAIGLCAQTIEQLDEKIVMIKRDASYVNGSDFRSDELSARKRAFHELADQVNSMRVDAGQAVMMPRQIMEYADEITYEEDGYFNVFFYVSKAEIISAKEGSRPAVPRKVWRHASGEAPDIFIGMSEDQPPVTRPKPEEKPAAPVSEPPTPRKDAEPGRQNNPLPPGNVGSDYVARALSSIATYEEAALYIKKYKKEGYVTDYSFARGINEIQPDMYLVVIDGDKKIVGIMMPEQGSLRRNLITGSNEDISSYLGNHYILWFRCR